MIVFAVLGTFTYITFGVGIRELLINLNHGTKDFPILLIVWPILLLMFAFYPPFAKGE